MKKLKIVGFAGQKECGKSTSSKRILKEAKDNGYENIQTYSFAGPIKKYCMALLKSWGVKDPEKYLLDTKYKEQLIPGFPFSGRTMQKDIGEYAKQTIKPDIWLEGLETLILSSPEIELITLDDVRFDFEVEVIKRYGGVVYRLTGGVGGDSHISENALRGYPLPELTPIFGDDSFEYLNPARDYLNIKLVEPKTKENYS